eukprot:COSAG02_NODE_15193_length_1195_cov_0.950730_2_plen_275_part_01
MPSEVQYTLFLEALFDQIATVLPESVYAEASVDELRVAPIYERLSDGTKIHNFRLRRLPDILSLVGSDGYLNIEGVDSENVENIAEPEELELDIDGNPVVLLSSISSGRKSPKGGVFTQQEEKARGVDSEPEPEPEQHTTGTEEVAAVKATAVAQNGAGSQEVSEEPATTTVVGKAADEATSQRAPEERAVEDTTVQKVARERAAEEAVVTKATSETAATEEEKKRKEEPTVATATEPETETKSATASEALEPKMEDLPLSHCPTEQTAVSTLEE